MLSEFWTILPNWISLFILLALAIITWWYARSTRDMARIMKETYEAETSPQLGCALESITRTPHPPMYLDISLQLQFTNAGKYALSIKAVSLTGRVNNAALNYPIPLPPGIVILAPNQNFPLSGNAIIIDKAQNLQIKVDFEDFKGRSHSKEFPFPQ